MPVTVTDFAPWVRPPPTAEQLDYAELASIDLSKWPVRKTELLEDMRHAVHDVGFWFVVGHGISDREVVRQLSIGKSGS